MVSYLSCTDMSRRLMFAVDIPILSFRLLIRYDTAGYLVAHLQR